MSHQRFTAAAILAVAALALTACSTPTESDEPSTGSDLRIAFFSPITANSFVAAEIEGIQAAADEAGAEVTVFDANGDSNAQVSQIQTATTSGNFDAFVVTPLNSAAVVEPITAAIDAGILVACAYGACGADSAGTTNQIEGLTLQVGVDFAAEGDSLGTATQTACDGIDPCQVAYVPGFPTPQEQVRRQGFLDNVASADNIEVVASEQDGGSSKAGGLTVVTDLLTAHSDLDVITLAADSMALGADQAIADRGLTGDIAIISDGGSELAVSAITEGRWFASVPTFPRSFGAAAVEGLVAAANGDAGPDYIDQSGFDTVGGVLTADNVNDFTPEYSGE